MLVVRTMNKKHRRQIDIRKVATSEGAESVLGEVLDPFISWAVVQVRVVWESRRAVVMITAHDG